MASKDCVINLRCSEAELTKWKEVAKQSDVTLSDFIRGVTEWYCDNKDSFTGSDTRPSGRTSFFQRLNERNNK